MQIFLGNTTLFLHINFYYVQKTTIKSVKWENTRGVEMVQSALIF